MGTPAFDLWDLIQRPSGLENEEERRRRQESDMLMAQPVAEDVPDLTSFQPEPEVIQAPRILGTQDQTMQDILQQKREWAGRMPTYDQNKPSTKRQILGGLAGFLTALANPQAGAAVTEGIIRGPYRRKVGEWEREGKAIGEVGALGQDISATQQRRESDILGYEGTQGKIETQRSAIEQRREAENLRHEDRMGQLTADSDKRKETARHNKVIESLAGESNRIRTIEAGARKTSAEAYSRSVDAREKPGAKPLPPQYRQAVMDAMGEMLAADPYAQQWFTRDPKNKDQIIVKPGLQITEPADLQRFKTFLERAKARGRRAIYPEEETDVQEYNPLRQEVP